MRVEEKVLLAGMELLVSAPVIRIYGTPTGILQTLRDYPDDHEVEYWQGYSVHVVTWAVRLTPDPSQISKDVKALGDALHKALPDRLIVGEGSTGLGWTWEPIKDEH